MKKLYLFIFFVLLVSCGGNKTMTSETKSQVSFSEDSAYQYIAEQVAFGARVPGTLPHQECYAYLVSTLTRLGAQVEVEQGLKTNYAGEEQPILNIIGRYGDESKKRILLCAHWDCRPWSDQEEAYENRQTPVLGANDGASGVGVLLEVARQLQQRQTSGETLPAIDIVFFDCEDMGTPDFYTGKQRENTWCLGSQLWAERHKGETQAYQFGILLDMVGSAGAVFPKEYISMQYAQQYVDKVWRCAAQQGFAEYFVQSGCYPITDDHYYVNTIANIPCIDIIHYEQGTETGFAHYWHTNHDDMKNIDRATLLAVGRTVMATIVE